MKASQLRAWREAHGLSQGAAAKLVNKSLRMYSRYEKGNPIPADVLAIVLAKGTPDTPGEADPFIIPRTHPHLYTKWGPDKYTPTREHPGFVKHGKARYECRVSELDTYVPPEESPEPSFGAALDASVNARTPEEREAANALVRRLLGRE